MNQDEGRVRRLAQETLDSVEGLTGWQARQVETQTKLAHALLEALAENKDLEIGWKNDIGVVHAKRRAAEQRVSELEEALRHVQMVMDTQVAESQRGVGRSYSMSPGGYRGIQNALRDALSPKESSKEE